MWVKVVVRDTPCVFAFSAVAGGSSQVPPHGQGVPPCVSALRSLQSWNLSLTLNDTENTRMYERNLSCSEMVSCSLLEY